MSTGPGGGTLEVIKRLDGLTAQSGIQTKFDQNGIGDGTLEVIQHLDGLTAQS